MLTTLRNRFARPLMTSSVLLALAAGPLACSSDADTTAVPSAQAVKDEKPPAPESKTIADLVTPDSVVVYGGVDGAATMFEAATKIGRSIDPSVPDVATMMPQQIADDMGLKDATVIDTSKPVHFAMLDPKANSDAGLVLTFAATKETLGKALPDDKKEGDGHAFSWKKDAGEYFADFAGDFVVITREKGLYEKHKDFFNELAVSKLDKQGTTIVDVAHIRKLYQTDIDQGFAMLKQQMTQPSPFGGADPTKMGPIVDWMKTHFGDMDKAILRTELTADRSTLELEFRYADGSDAKKLFSQSAPMPALHAGLPKETAAVMVGNFAPFRESLASMLKWAATLSFQGGGEAVTEATDAYWDATTSEFVMAAIPVPDVGLTMVGITGVTDPAKAREAQHKIAEAYNSDPQVKQGLDMMGMKLSFKKNAYKIGDQEIDINETKISGPMADMPMMEIMQSFMTTHSTFKDKAGYVAYGASAKGTLEALLGDKLEGGLDKAGSLTTAFKDAAPNPFVLAFASIDDMKSQLEGGEAKEAKDGIALSLGTKDGALIVKFGIPTSEIAAGGAAAAQLQGALMGGMGGPPPGLAQPGGAQGGSAQPAPGLK